MVGESKIVWNPYSKGYFKNPYPHLKECRDTNPIQFGIGDSVFLFRHKDIYDIIRSKDFIVSDLSAFFKEKEDYIFKNTTTCPFLAKGTQLWPMYLNGEIHKRIRVAITKAFHSLNLEEILEKSIHETNLEFENRNSFDLIDYCSKYIFNVTNKIFNFKNTEDYLKIKEYSNLLAKSQDLYIPKQIYNQINDSFIWGKGLFSSSPFKSIIMEETADLNLSDEQIYSILAISLMASFETSKDSLAIGLLEIIKQEELINYVKNNEGKALNLLIEELFRYASPLQYTVRINTKPILIGGIEIKENTKFFLCIASANHDESIFEKPHKITPNRKDNPHLAFGGGEHFCLGSAIAKQELKIALKPMLHLLEKYTLENSENIKWSKQIFMRTIKSVPLIRK